MLLFIMFNIVVAAYQYFSKRFVLKNSIKLSTVTIAVKEFSVSRVLHIVTLLCYFNIMFQRVLFTLTHVTFSTDTFTFTLLSHSIFNKSGSV